MYRLMEGLNDSLQETDKIHSFKTFHDVNEGRTKVSFKYFPQFWLGRKSKSSFEESLEDLLKRFGMSLVFVFVCLCISLYVCVCLCMFVCLFVCLCLFLFVCLCLCMFVCLCLFLCIFGLSSCSCIIFS